MTERSMIHVGGSPGSGKSRMASAVVNHLRESGILAEHISIGDQVRRLAQGAISSPYQKSVELQLANRHTMNDPVKESIIISLLDGALSGLDDQGAEVVLLDGYPRYTSQTNTYFDLAQTYRYKTPGALITEVGAETAMTRMLKRGQKDDDRRIDAGQAWDKLISHNESYPKVIQQLGFFGTRFAMYHVNTDGPKNQTDVAAFEATRRLLRLSLDDGRRSA